MPGLWRRGSPPGGSTPTTLAPRSPSIEEQKGPGTLTHRSTIVKPESGLISPDRRP